MIFFEEERIGVITTFTSVLKFMFKVLLTSPETTVELTFPVALEVIEELPDKEIFIVGDVEVDKSSNTINGLEKSVRFKVTSPFDS